MLITLPPEIRPRAVLGDKTTNAKAKTNQPNHVKDVNQAEKNETHVKPTSHRRRKIRPFLSGNTKAEPIAQNSDDEFSDIEIAPKPVPELPFECDIIPPGGLTCEGLKPENRLRGYFQYYFNPIDENGVSLLESKYREDLEKILERDQRQIEKDIESLDWSIPDVSFTTKPIMMDTTRNGPSTLKSRAAATALSKTSNSSSRPSRIPRATTNNTKNKTTKTTKTVTNRSTMEKSLRIERPDRMDSALSVAASRNTLGYSRGRAMMKHGIRDKNKLTVSSKVDGDKQHFLSRSRHTLVRSASAASRHSDKTITPASYAQGADIEARPAFLDVFEPVSNNEDQSDDDTSDTHPYDIFGDIEEEVNIQIL